MRNVLWDLAILSISMLPLGSMAGITLVRPADYLWESWRVAERRSVLVAKHRRRCPRVESISRSKPMCQTSSRGFPSFPCGRSCRARESRTTSPSTVPFCRLRRCRMLSTTVIPLQRAG
jgi:hypothetical protein